MINLPKLFILFGIGIFILGVILWGIGKFIPIGKLPGDIHYQGDQTSFYFPIVTCIIISVVLTILINLFFWLRNG